jgi:deoxyribodipyrimidine photolyase
MDIGDGEGLRTLETLSGDDAKLVSGGRKEGLKKLRALKTLRGYSEGRHMLDMETSLMSAYHKFGCVSPRES